MQILIDPHTLERAEERGTDEGEIRDVLSSGFPIPAKYGRFQKAKVYDFNQERHGRFYEQKRVEVVYTVKEDVIITVTAYVFTESGEERCELSTTPRQTCFTFAWMNANSQ